MAASSSKRSFRGEDELPAGDGIGGVHVKHHAAAAHHRVTLLPRPGAGARPPPSNSSDPSSSGSPPAKGGEGVAPRHVLMCTTHQGGVAGGGDQVCKSLTQAPRYHKNIINIKPNSLMGIERMIVYQ